METTANPSTFGIPEVKFYEVFDSQNEKHLGSFYADWHLRPTSFRGMDELLKNGNPR